MTGFLDKAIVRVKIADLDLTARENVDKHLDWGSGTMCPISSTHEGPMRIESGVLRCRECGWETATVPEEMTKW